MRRPAVPRDLASWAPAVFVVLWSTGFVVARYATVDAGPLTFLAVRMVITVVLLAGISIVSRSSRPDRTTARWTAVASLGLHVGYLGGIFIAIDQGLPSGLSALIAGLHPVVTAFGSRLVLGERLRRMQWAGVALGCLGVGVVVVERLSHGGGEVTAGALVAMAVSVLGMAGGTLVQRSRAAAMPLLWGTTVQYATAALVFGIGAVSVERFEVTVTARFLFSLLWAVVVLSIVSVSLMLWLLSRHAAARVSSLFFLTPALSTIEGAVLFDERLGWPAIVGLGIGLAGVALVARQPPPPAPGGADGSGTVSSALSR